MKLSSFYLPWGKAQKGKVNESKEHDFLKDKFIEKKDATPFSLIKLLSLCLFDYLIQKQLFAMLYTLYLIRYFNKVFFTCDSIERYWSKKREGVQRTLQVWRLLREKGDNWLHIFFIVYTF